MARTTFDEDELVDEASEELQADIEDTLARVREQIPEMGTVLTTDEGDLLDVLDSLTTIVDVEEIESTLQEAEKAFVIGQRAEAFGDEFITNTEATIATLEETIDSLQTINTTATSLSVALTGFQDRDEIDTGATENNEGLPEEHEETTSKDNETDKSNEETPNEEEQGDLTNTADTDE